MKTTVACVFVRGHVPFTKGYVINLQKMVDKYLAREHRFVCLTDQPDVFKGMPIETVRIPTPRHGVFGWWSKLHLFDPGVEPLQSGRCLYLDLDTLIVNNLDPIVDLVPTVPFAIIPDGAPNFHGKHGRGVVKKYNSSVMVWNGGEFNKLFKDFRFSHALRLWGDQDWIGELLDTAFVMPTEWFPRLSTINENGDNIPADAKVILCKKPKNAMAAHMYPWFNQRWVL